MDSVNYSNGLQVGSRKSTLLLVDAELSDSGTYVCYGDNEISPKSEDSIYIYVVDKITYQQIGTSA